MWGVSQGGIKTHPESTGFWTRKREAGSHAAAGREPLEKSQRSGEDGGEKPPCFNQTSAPTRERPTLDEGSRSAAQLLARPELGHGPYNSRSWARRPERGGAARTNWWAEQLEPADWRYSRREGRDAAIELRDAMLCRRSYTARSP